MSPIRRPLSMRAKLAILGATGLAGAAGLAGGVAGSASAQTAHPADLGLGVITVTYYHNDGNGLTEDGTQLITVLGYDQCTQLDPPSGANYYQVDDAISDVQGAVYADSTCTGDVTNFAGPDEYSYQDMLPSDPTIAWERSS
jgi:hypothetical protein